MKNKTLDGILKDTKIIHEPQCPFQYQCADKDYGGSCEKDHYNCPKYYDWACGDAQDIYTPQKRQT